MPHPAITLRPIQPEDKPFLFQLFASHTRDALASQMDAPQLDALLELQFNIQHSQYQQQFSQADFDLILLENEPIGQLILDRREEEFRLVEIAILPEYRNRGFGRLILQGILAEAAEQKKPVRLHVVNGNPAVHLYTRLGFTQIGDADAHIGMEWTP